MSPAAISPRKRCSWRRLVTELLPEEPEALGLLALMLHARSAAPRAAQRGRRLRAAGRAGSGAVGLRDMIDEAEALLRRAGALGAIGRYQLEGALQSAHVHRCRTGRANWAEVVQLYDALLALAGSPVVAINRALAIAELRRRRRRARGDAGSRRRCAARRIPALLGRARGAAGAGPARTAKPAAPTRSPSASSATPRSAAFCKRGRRRWRTDRARQCS